MLSTVSVGRWVALASVLLSSTLVVTGAAGPAGDDGRSGDREPELTEPVPVTAAGTPEVDRWVGGRP